MFCFCSDTVCACVCACVRACVCLKTRKKWRMVKEAEREEICVQPCDLQCWALGKINLWETWAAWQSHSYTGLTGRQGQAKQTHIKNTHTRIHRIAEAPHTQHTHRQAAADSQSTDMRCNNTQWVWAHQKRAHLQQHMHTCRRRSLRFTHLTLVAADRGRRRRTENRGGGGGGDSRSEKEREKERAREVSPLLTDPLC